MEFANPVKLLGRVLLLVYGLCGGSHDSRPPEEAKQQVAKERAARLEKLQKARETSVRQRETKHGDLGHGHSGKSERLYKVLHDELERLAAERQRAREAVQDAQKLADEKLRELQRLREELKQQEDHSDSLQRRIDELRNNVPRQQRDVPQQQESTPHSRREAILGRVSLPAMRSIDGHGWRVDGRGIIRHRQSQPIGVWGVDDGEPGMKRKR